MRCLRSAALAAALVCALPLPPARAASDPSAPLTGSFTVRSTPSGGSVRLSGTLRAVGQTPFRAPDFPVGTYRVSVGRKGYYTRRTTLLLSPGDSLLVQADLKPKSRYMGVARSLLVPGWGQSFNERPGRAAFYLGAELVTAGVATYLATQYNHSVTRYEAIADSLQAARTVEGIGVYTAKLAERDRAWRSHYDNARAAAFVAAGVWILSAVDAYVFGPARDDLPGTVSLEATPPGDLGALGDAGDDSGRAGTSRLALTVRFR